MAEEGMVREAPSLSDAQRGRLMAGHTNAAVSGEANRGSATGRVKASSYLFAVVPAESVRDYDCVGIEDKPVFAITEGRLAAVVCSIDGNRIRPERRHLAAHQGVLKRLLADTTPLPLSFGTLADSPDAIRNFLRRHQRTFRDQLQRVGGQVEMGVRVTWDVPNIFEFFVNTHAELREARDRLLGSTHNPTQEEKIELGRMFDRLLSEDRESYTEEVDRILSTVCTEVMANKCRNEREVMNLACLVPRDAQEAFGNAVFRAAQMFDNNFAFDYNGPWAPHNFVEADLTP